MPLGQQLGHRPDAVHPDVEPLARRSRTALRRGADARRSRLVHGARRRPGPRAARRPAIRSSSSPRRRASAPADAVGSVCAAGAGAGRDVADEQLVGHRLLRAAGRRCAGAAGTGRRTRASCADEWSSPYHQNQSLPSAIRISSRACGQRRRVAAGLARRRAPAGRRPAGSSPLIVGVADPDVEVRVDPRAGEDAGSAGAAAPRTPRPSSRSAASGCVCEPAVQRAKERPPAALEVLPGVLAVQDDRDERLFPAGPFAIARGPPRPGAPTKSSAAASAAQPAYAKPIRSDSAWSRNAQATLAPPARDRVRPRTAVRAGRPVRAPSRVKRGAERPRENQLVGGHPAGSRPRRPAAPWRRTPTLPTATGRPAAGRTAARGSAAARSSCSAASSGCTNRCRGIGANRDASAGRRRVSHSSGRIG